METRLPFILKFIFGTGMTKAECYECIDRIFEKIEEHEILLEAERKQTINEILRSMKETPS